jgi:hypothetical protein
MFSSCQEPISGWTKHVYRNSSDHIVELRSYSNGNEYKSFTLKQVEDKVFDNFASEGKNNPPFDEPRYIGVDSVVTIFDDTLSIMYDRGRLDGNPMRIENYELVEGETEPYIYLFEFTNEDYERALERGRIIK